MADLATMLIERLVQLERRLKDLERREYTSGGTTPSSLTVEEEDATPSVGSVDTIQVPNGTLTDDGGGTVSLDYAPSAKGVTNGDSHDHAGGDGAQIDHTGLSNLNSTTYTHLTAANHTDLTDSGATTLHKHDHGGMDGLTDDDHPQYLSYPCNGRLTLESGVPFSTTDQSAKTTLYFTPYKGNKISLYDGSAIWNTLSFTELSITLAGLTASKPYDVFCYNNAGTATLELLVWTNATTRATALTTQNGVLVKSGATTRRYLGTIYINSSGGQTDATTVKRYVWNYYNRLQRSLIVTEATAHTYNGAARKWNNSDTGNLLEYIVGYVEGSVMFYYRAGLRGGADGSYAAVDLYLDGSMMSEYYRLGNFNIQTVIGGAAWQLTASLGYHAVQVYELSNHASSYFVNMMMSVGLGG